jgi:hypothetical protein
MFAIDRDSDRATSIEDYQNTCTEFINDISNDYKSWVERYSLSEEETNLRKMLIDSIVEKTNNWIFKYGNSIKKVDIIMNDGVNKMAENTAGYPFKVEIFVNNMSRYTLHPVGEVKLNIRAIPRNSRCVRIGNYQKEQLLMINSNSVVNFAVNPESLKSVDILNDYIVIDAKNCKAYDLISVTVVVEEAEANYVTERRGYSTLILLS